MAIGVWVSYERRDGGGEGWGGGVAGEEVYVSVCLRKGVLWMLSVLEGVSEGVCKGV